VAYNVGAATIYYDAGIIDSDECKVHDSNHLNHAINLVGYGTCPKTGKKYWVLRNSWSSYWGDEGYFKVVRGEKDCGVSTDAGFPILAVGDEAEMKQQEVQQAEDEIYV